MRLDHLLAIVLLVTTSSNGSVAIVTPAPASLVRLESVNHAFDMSFLRRAMLPPGSRPEAALASVDLDIPPGAVLACCGDSGSGKSTLLAILAQELEPSGGVVAFSPACRPHLVSDVEFKGLSGELKAAGSLETALAAERRPFLSDAARGKLLALFPDEMVRRSFEALPTASQCAATAVLALGRCFEQQQQEEEEEVESEGSEGIDNADGDDDNAEGDTGVLLRHPLLLMDELLDGAGPSAWATAEQRVETDRVLRAACASFGASIVYATHCDHHARLADRVLFFSRGAVKQDAPPDQSIYWKWKEEQQKARQW
jgi:energy-coupling factor transporter ATP-binding protein EcfA2